MSARANPFRIGAFVAGGVVVAVLARFIPDDIPVEFVASRALFVVIGIVVTAIVGSAVSFRRIVRIDPAANLGTGT